MQDGDDTMLSGAAMHQAKLVTLADEKLENDMLIVIHMMGHDKRKMLIVAYRQCYLKRFFVELQSHLLTLL